MNLARETGHGFCGQLVETPASLDVRQYRGPRFMYDYRTILGDAITWRRDLREIYSGIA